MDRVTRYAFAVLTALTFFGAAGCTKSYDPQPQQFPEPPAATVTLADLQLLCDGRPVIIDEPLVVTGLVTTSDRAGNFFRTLCIEEELAGLEIRCGLDNLHARYPAGTRVWLHLQGLCLEREYGVLQAGIPAVPGNPEAGSVPFGSQALLDAHLIRGNREQPRMKGHIYHGCELTPALIGTLALVHRLRWVPDDENTAPDSGDSLRRGTWGSGYRRFIDRDGVVIHTYISPYAQFADAPLTDERPVSVRGLLQYISTGPHAGYVVKPRDENDLFYL